MDIFILMLPFEFIVWVIQGQNYFKTIEILLEFYLNDSKGDCLSTFFKTFLTLWELYHNPDSLIALLPKLKTQINYFGLKKKKKIKTKNVGVWNRKTVKINLC